MLLTVVWSLLGLVLLAVAADQLVLGAGRLAARMRIAPVVVGVVIIGLGTSAPEFVVSGLAAARGEVGLATGNLVGSNIFNLTLILGIAALVAPVAVRSSVVRREAPLSVAATVAFAGCVVLGLGRGAGLLLAVGSVAALIALIRLAVATPTAVLPAEVDDYLDGRDRRGIPIEVGRALLGLTGTLAGAQLLVTNASTVALRLGVSPTVVGFTMVAVGTSLPELVTAVQAQRRAAADLLVGNLLGSNLFNSLTGGAVVGLSASGARPHLATAVLVAMVFVALLSWALLFRGYRVTRVEAGVLIGAYLLCLPLLGS